MSNHKNIIIPKVNKPRNKPNGKSEPDQDLQNPDNMYSGFVALH
jgi:hypothetical protein